LGPGLLVVKVNILIMAKESMYCILLIY